MARPFLPLRHCPNFTSSYNELMSVLHSILSVLNVKALVGAFNVQPGEGPHGFNERVGYEDALVLGLDEGGECG